MAGPADPEIAEVPAEGLRLEAIHAFDRIDPRKLNERSAESAGFAWLGSGPALLRHQDGSLFTCLRYGVIVLCGASETSKRALFQTLEDQGNPRLTGDVEYETLTLRVDRTGAERCSGDELWVTAVTARRLQLAAVVLGRSVILASYEEALRDADRLVEPLARQMAMRGASLHSPRTLLRQIGSALAIRQALFSRAEVTESPDLLWENPELERLFHRLMVEFDVRARSVAVAEKVNVVADTARTALELVRHSQTLRVEWYIVILIVFEIALTVLGH